MRTSPPPMQGLTGNRYFKFVLVLAAVFLLTAGIFAAPISADEYREVNNLDDLKTAISASNSNPTTEYLIVVNNTIEVISDSPDANNGFYAGFKISGNVVLTTNKTHDNMLIWNPASGTSQSPMFEVENEGQLTLQDNSTVEGEAKVLTLNGLGSEKEWNYPVILVNSDAVFTMTGGIITGHHVHVGGRDGAGVKNSGEFYMSGGTICGNTAGYGGGVYNGKSFTMSGGTICGNTAIYDGGGVYNEGYFEMSGNAVIGGDDTDSANKANWGGGVANNADYAEDGSSPTSGFYMKGGTIKGNEAVFLEDGTEDYLGLGGGVYNEGTFEMSGNAVIEGNDAELGGGVYNSVEYVDGEYPDSVYFAMLGGSIKDNTAEQNGGGVYNEGVFYVSGSSKVIDNKGTSDGSANNVYIPSDDNCIQVIYLENAEIGVTHFDQGAIKPGDKSTDKTVAEEEEPIMTSDYKDFFIPDDSAYVTEFREKSLSSEDETYQTGYIVLTKKPYTLTWNFDGGDVTSGDDYTKGDIEAGTKIKYPSVNKSGYTFTGWNPNPETMPAADTTITALWEPVGGGDDSPKGSSVWLSGNPGPFKFEITELIIFYVTMPYDYMGSVKLIAKSGTELPPGLEALAAADIALTEEMKDGQKAKVTAKVPQFLLDGNNVKPEDIAIYQLVNGEWVKLQITWHVDENGYVHFETETDLLGLFALVIENGGVSPSETSEAKSPLSVLAVLGGIGAASFVLRRK